MYDGTAHNVSPVLRPSPELRLLEWPYFGVEYKTLRIRMCHDVKLHNRVQQESQGTDRADPLSCVNVQKQGVVSQAKYSIKASCVIGPLEWRRIPRCVAHRLHKAFVCVCVCVSVVYIQYSMLRELWDCHCDPEL